MSDLEKLAKGLFEKYSQHISGKKADWRYLSKQRKLIWMKEVLVYTDYISTQLKAKFKQPPKVRPNETSYAAGYNQGMAEERFATLNFIDYIDDNLHEQLQDFIDTKD